MIDTDAIFYTVYRVYRLGDRFLNFYFIPYDMDHIRKLIHLKNLFPTWDDSLVLSISDLTPTTITQHIVRVKELMTIMFQVKR